MTKVFKGNNKFLNKQGYNKLTWWQEPIMVRVGVLCSVYIIQKENKSLLEASI